MSERRPDLIALGIFGSWTRDDWSVGSDLDLVAIVSQSERPFVERPLGWHLLDLPVPAEIVVYLPEEWRKLEGRFGRMLREETSWLVGSPPSTVYGG